MSKQTNNRQTDRHRIQDPFSNKNPTPPKFNLKHPWIKVVGTLVHQNEVPNDVLMRWRGEE